MIRDTNNDEKLPRIPVLTPERQAEADTEQAKRAKIVNISSNPNHRAFATALKVIEGYEVYGDDLPKSAVPFYVDALSAVGRYADAYKWSGDEFYNEIDNALTSDKKTCDCPDTQVVELENGQPITKTYSRFFTRRKVYSRIDSTWHDLKMCNVCHALTI